jgi:hypothetical protein
LVTVTDLITASARLATAAGLRETRILGVSWLNAPLLPTAD